MKSVYPFICAVFMVLASCKSADSKATTEQIQSLESLVAGKRFKIESSWAYPQMTTATMQVLNSGILQPGSNASSINLIGNPNFLTISGDSISSYLPYYGERQMSVGYRNNDNAIQLKGPLKDYTVQKGKKQSIVITCDAGSDHEAYNVTIRLYPNLKSNITIVGATRTSISYSGTANHLEEPALEK